jgi:hypothetical protein
MGVKRLMDIDERDAAVVEDVKFPPHDVPLTLIALTHPSLRNANVGRRRYGGFSGGEAELAMLKRCAGIHDPGGGRSMLPRSPQHCGGRLGE